MIQIQKAEIQDLSTIQRFQLEMAWETENLQLSPETVHAGVKAVLQDPNKGTYWVALQQGNLVGCLLTIPEWSDWRNGTVLWIHSVYVEPKSRGQGIYKSLYQHIKNQVLFDPEKRFRGIRLYVDKRNVAAQEVYRKLSMNADHYDLYEWMP